MVTEPTSAKPQGSLSPRRRRLRATLLILGSLACVGIVVGVSVLLLRRTKPYQPGEASSDVTSALSRHLPPEAPKPVFTDVTKESGLAAFKNFAGSRTSQLPEDMGPGLAWGDYDGDGDEDLFAVSAGGSLKLAEPELYPCVLFENLGNGAFRAVEDFPETRIRGMGAAWGDYDGDGFLDLAVSGYNALLLFHNEASGGRRRLVRDARLENRPGFWAGLSWADYDHDRDLDLYVCQYVLFHEESNADPSRSSSQLGTFVPFTLNPASYEPGKNLLLRNDGDGRFTDVAEALGVTNEKGRSLGALWHDFDEDGWLDLYVANDISDNVFYRNTGGTFTDVSHASWVADYRSAMGLAAGDYNRDGDDDLFITHWVAQENALYDNVWADFNPSLSSTNQTNRARPSSLSSSSSNTLGGVSRTKDDYEGRGGGTRDEGGSSGDYPMRFVDANEQKGLGQVALPMVGWGTEFVDLDADGWLDLVVVNGSTIEMDEPPPKRLRAQVPFLFWNQRGQFFHDLAPLNPAWSQPHVSRGMAVADVDGDSDMDVVIAHLGEGLQLLRNDMPQGHWLKIRLKSKTADGNWLGFGEGSKVIVRAGDFVLRRAITSVSYLSQSSRELHFGLGPVAEVKEVEVRWSAGGTNRFQGLKTDAVWELREEDPVAKEVSVSRSAAASSVTEITSVGVGDEKTRIIEFWKYQRAAMNAVKVEQDIPKAIGLFRQALALNPDHEDSLYYLAQCLAQQDDGEGALRHLQHLKELNPQSLRGYQQWGILRARFARTASDLAEAQTSLERAHQINPEETGALLALGELCLMRDQFDRAKEHLADACRSNPKAVGGFYLQAFLAWKGGDREEAAHLLNEAKTARGPDWQPKGTTSEGDVRRKQHADSTPLAQFWEEWDGNLDPGAAFPSLSDHLRSIPR